MNRQQRRASERKEAKSKTKIYMLTEYQLREYVRKEVENVLKIYQEETINSTINTTLALTLALPLEVLMDHYWIKSYSKRIPEFTNYVLEYYKRWQNGELDMNKLLQDLWEYGGVRLEEEK